ncbi:HAMP domain-containing sensor histidine kinase [Mesorhizobium sp. SARCC-RB16n]|uniref:sensor histidine kinase n=1 Tax=Mesorhizobium sp. SARCC-RB16n TaxID=2116687 RepID=UPI00122F0200|nr:HAMP domain-containing sensor histidine kinase [Mesorhizobium sp. SARCC-RB16n]
MHKIRILETASFRRTIGAAAILAVALLSMAGFLYRETVGYLTRQIDDALIADARSFANSDPASLPARIQKALADDRRREKAFGIFAIDRTRLAGNMAVLPPILPGLDNPQTLTLSLNDGGGSTSEHVRIVSATLKNGNLLVLGHATESVDEIREIIVRALLLAVFPALAISLIGGVGMSRAMLRRVEAVRRACSSIMQGHFDRRLPVHKRQDEFDKLSVIVNAMLDEIERLVGDVKGAGDAIAHDLRTPLTRLRSRLERSMRAISDDGPVKEAMQKSLGDIDQLLATIAALMRIAEVEQSRRRENFSKVDLGEIVTALAEFYQPIAEERGLDFVVVCQPVALVDADGDLLFEALANLVDNAIKFTPADGRVGLELVAAPTGSIVRVWDTGSGIPAEERGNVLRRFYRLDPSRQTPGTGLGLSLVSAIARLHQFPLSLRDSDSGGLNVELLCPANGDAEIA